MKILSLLVTSFFVLLLYFCIDWVLKIILTELSRAGHEGTTVKDIYGQTITIKRTDTAFLWRIAGIALLITTAISITSNFMVADQLSGDSPYQAYQQQILASLSLNDKASNQAIETLHHISTDTALMDKRERIIYTAIHSEEHQSWINDYENAKGNMKAWFWTCTQCPKGYKAYRNRILKAMQEADALEEEATSTSITLTQNIAQTLEGVSDTTMLSKLETVSGLLNEDKENKEWLINAILLAMTLGGAVLSVILTKLLKKHREANGQLVNDNPATMLMAFTGLFKQRPSPTIQEIHAPTETETPGIISEATEENPTSILKNPTALHEEVEKPTNKRICQLEGCENDLDKLGLRADARYCCKEHRYKANAEKRKNTQNNIFVLNTRSRIKAQEL